MNKPLLSKLESLTGADRETDALIWLEVTPGATRRETRFIHKPTGKEQVIDETREPSGRLIVVPSYTASIDHALTLIPEGWFLGSLAQPDPVNQTQSYACLVQTEMREIDRGYGQPPDEDRDVIDARAATPALALCLSALKARREE